MAARHSCTHLELRNFSMWSSSVRHSTIIRKLPGFSTHGRNSIEMQPSALLTRAGSDIGVFARYENFDTQFRMPAGYVPLEEFDRDAWVVGATFWPDADIAVKVDYAIVRNQSRTIAAPNAFNVGLGWWF